MEVQGIVKMIGQNVQVSESFTTRDVVVTTQENYPQHILIQFTQANTALLDSVQVGQQVVISINLRGREYADKNTGQPRYFNTIQGWRIQVAGQQTQQQGGYQGQGSAVNDFKQQQAQQYNNGGQKFQQPQQQFNQQGYQQPQQYYQQPTQYQGQQNANFNQQMQQQAYQQQAFNNQGQAQMGDDDLPF